MFRVGTKFFPGEESAVLCALLSIWIYVIIFFVRDGAALRTVEMSPSLRVLVIDAGHGGLDGGAVSVTGRYESRINLEIALRLRDLAAFLGVPAVMTRDSEELTYPQEFTTIAARKKWDTARRVEMADSMGNVIFLSIHQNFFPSAKPRGPQVLYARDDVSRELGERLQELLTTTLLPESRRVAVPADKGIYIMSHVHCPAVLVECGFLSHPMEAALLENDTYQKKLAVLLMAGVLEYTGDEIV